MRQLNPRPRKYANAAEKAAAHRARWATLEVRALPETAATIASIAEERGIPQSELLYTMLQFALTNHNWRNPTFTIRIPRADDAKPSGEWFITNEYSRESGKWIANLRDKANVIVAKPLTLNSRTEVVALTWQDFEAFE